MLAQDWGWLFSHSELLESKTGRETLYMRFIWILLISVLMPSSLWAQAVVNVRVQVLSEVLVDFERRAPAEVRALNDSTIAAEVSAVVLSVHADVGQVVRKGDPDEFFTPRYHRSLPGFHGNTNDGHHAY